MGVLRERLFATAVCIAVSAFLSAGVSEAAKKVKIEVEAELEPCGAISPATSPCDPSGTPPEPGAEGTVEHKQESQNSVVKKNEFKAEVKIPFPSAPLGITDEAAAESADIRLILSHADGSEFAECRLAFAEIESEDEDDDEDDSGVYAEYKVDVRIKKGVVQAKKGTCTLIDPPGPGVPNAMAGDVATATLVSDSTNRILDVDFLQGPFEAD